MDNHNPNPMLVVVFGLPGSGKTYFATQLAARLNARLVSSDELRKQMFDTPTYTEDEKKEIYAAIYRQAKACCLKQETLVIDATYYKEQYRQQLLQGLGTSTHVIFIEVITREHIAKSRLAKKRPFSDADFSVYQQIKKEWEPFVGEHLQLESTNHNIDQMLETAMAFLHVEA